MRLLALFSGGKDSTFAVYDSIRKGHSVEVLVSMFPENPDSYMFHSANIHLAELQASSMGIPLVPKKTPGKKEEELRDLEAAVKEASTRFNAEGLVAGGLASKYQRNRIQGIANRLHLKLLSPYWGSDPLKYWNLILDSGFKVVITRVSCEGLGREWLGRIIDRKALSQLETLSKRYSFHLAFEGGEAETLVLDCPLFTHRLDIEKAKTIWEGDSGTYLIERAGLKEK